MKALLIGLGFFSQNCHLKLLKKNRSIKKIYVFDEREQLTKNIAKKFNVINLNKKDFKNLKKKIDFAIVSTDRSLTYKYSKLILSKKINLLSEKPMAFNYKYAKKLHDLAKINRVLYEVGYQKNHDTNFKIIKKKLENLNKIYGDLNETSFELFGGDFRLNKKTLVRTNEHLKLLKYHLPIFLKKKFHINYIVFLNRYLHSIFLFFDLFKINNIDQLKLIKFKILDVYNYKLNFIYNNIKVSFNFANYKPVGWHDKLFLSFDKLKIQQNFKSPLLFKLSTIKMVPNGKNFKNKPIDFKKDGSNHFEKQLNFFIFKIKNSNKGNSSLSLLTHKFVDKIWKLSNDKK